MKKNQPLFGLVWIGSIIAVVTSAVFGFGQLDGTGRLLISLGTLAYLVGVQLPTVTINIPLNINYRLSMPTRWMKQLKKRLEKRSNRVGTDGTQSGQPLPA